MFHVKHFGPIGRLKLTWPHTKCGLLRVESRDRPLCHQDHDRTARREPGIFAYLTFAPKKSFWIKTLNLVQLYCRPCGKSD